MADRAFPQLPRAPKVTARAAPRPKVSHVRLSPLLYRAALFGPLAGVVVAGAYATVASVPAIPIAIAAALLVFVAGVQLSLVYHMWAAIRDEHTPLQPRTAALLLLLPLFNVYWAFRVLPGYATAYNAFTARYLLRLPRLSQNLILASMVVPVFGVAIYWVVVGKLCEAVNAIASGPRSPASVRGTAMPGNTAQAVEDARRRAAGDGR